MPTALASLLLALSGHGLLYAGKARCAALDERSWSQAGSLRLSADCGAYKLKVASEPDGSAEAGRARLAEWKARFLGQFEGEAAYPGMVTRAVSVPESLRPRPAHKKDRSVWLAPATERLTFGAGSPDLAPLRAVVSHRWCAKKGRAVELSLFYPAEGFDEKAALAEEARYSCL